MPVRVLSNISICLRAYEIVSQAGVSGTIQTRYRLRAMSLCVVTWHGGAKLQLFEQDASEASANRSCAPPPTQSEVEIQGHLPRLSKHNTASGIRLSVIYNEDTRGTERGNIDTRRF